MTGLPARTHIPELHHAGQHRGRQGLAVAGEGHGIDRPRIHQPPGFLGLAHIPEADFAWDVGPAVAAGRRQQFTVRGEGHTPHHRLVSFEHLAFLSRDRVPQRTVRSQLPEASVRPSGEKVTEKTPCECPLRVVCSRPVAAFQSLTAPKGTGGSLS